MNDNTAPLTGGEPVKLYDATSAGLAVFFGSPLAGGLVVRRNFIALGDRRSANRWMLLSVIFTLGVFALAYLLPEDFPTSLFTVLNSVIAFGYSELVKNNFRKEVEVRKLLGKGLYSRWRPVGIGLAISIVLLGAIFGSAYLSDYNKYNTEADKVIRTKFLEVAALEEKADRISDYSYSYEEFLEALDRYTGYWNEIDRLTGEILEIARENGRKGCVEFLTLYREIPPLKIQLARVNLSPPENDRQSQPQAPTIEAALERVDRRVDKFFDSIDSSTEDILYLLP